MGTGDFCWWRIRLKMYILFICVVRKNRFFLAKLRYVKYFFYLCTLVCYTREEVNGGVKQLKICAIDRCRLALSQEVCGKSVAECKGDRGDKPQRPKNN